MKENQRIRLSKQMLRASFTDLLQNKNINNISIREICDHAEINRTTFYKYYGSQFDLLSDMENEFLLEIESKLQEENDSKVSSLSSLIYVLEQNINLCRILFYNNVDPKFPEKLFNHPLIHTRISQFLGKSENRLAFPSYTSTFIINGTFCILKEWINKETRETPEEIANYITHLIGSI